MNKPKDHQKQSLLIELVTLIDRTIIFPQIEEARQPLCITTSTTENSSSFFSNGSSRENREEKKKILFIDESITSKLSTQVKTKISSLDSSNKNAKTNFLENILGEFQWNLFVNVDKNQQKIQGLQTIDKLLNTEKLTIQQFHIQIVIIENQYPDLTDGDTSVLLNQIKAAFNPQVEVSEQNKTMYLTLGESRSKC